jgi:hypothetical protein
MKVDDKIIIENILKKNGATELNKEIFQILLDVVQAETLGKKVSIALNQRSQGHFDKAMLNISEANRDQVLSIREIQAIIDQAKGKLKTEVVFEKYRQFYPFQIGLTHGEDVLELLSLIKDECDFDLEELVADLHKNEEMIAPIYLKTMRILYWLHGIGHFCLWTCVYHLLVYSVCGFGKIIVWKNGVAWHLYL